jgi:two-component system, OmpR family, sensor histidine kinase NblS
MNKYIKYNSKLSLSLIPENLKLVELAHELKLPLFNIKSFLETLYEYNFELTNGQRLEFLEIANKETDRLINVITSLIELQIDHSFYKNHVSLLDLISQIINSYKLTAKNKSVDLLCKSQKVDYIVYGDSNLIGQVINNLVGNSLKYTFQKKTIFIRSRAFLSFQFIRNKKDRKLNVSILDQGIGIPRERIQDLVASDLNARTTDLTNVVKGNGLGLQVVKHILYRHNSSLEITSSLSKGSSVGFSLAVGKPTMIAGEGT